MALPPLPLQAQVKKHIQVVLEQLLHTVNRRVIVLERENPLRVSPAAPLPLGSHGGDVTDLGGPGACDRLCSSPAPLPGPSRMGMDAGDVPRGMQGEAGAVLGAARE